MDPKQQFAKAVDEASSCVLQTKEADLANPTPCTEWNLRQLLNHMVYELLWVPDMLMGRTIKEVGTKHDGDVLRSDPQAAWQHAADTALVAVKHADLADTVHLSYGDRPAGDYVLEVARDMLIHGWDVGRALKCSLMFDKTLAQCTYDYTLAHKDELAGGDFGTPQKTAPDASVQVKLLALLGRRTDIEP